MSNVYKQRLNQVKNYLREHKIEAALITSPTSIYYLTGFFSDPHERFLALFMDSRNDRDKLIVPSLDLEAALETSYVKDVVPISDIQNPYEQLAKLAGAELNNLAVEKRQINLLQFDHIRAIFPSVQLSNMENYLENLRSRKTEKDIAFVREAVEIAEQVISYGVKQVKVGMTELELTAELEYQMKILGAERPAFDTTVLTGVRTALPHGKPGMNRIHQGDFLLLDLGVFIHGYCSDITRTFILGEASKEQSTIYQTVLEANLQAIAAVKVGEELGKIDLEARNWIEAKGYGKYFVHRVGHGLGLEIHEPPSIHSQNQDKVEPGLLFTVEPGIYIPGIGGVRIEDDIYIREDGTVEVLTTYPKVLKNLCT
ncbi:MAG TPA: Xaa-Pro peptidase family protein [Bacillota bacterium]|nr:Xaa-Pro peptidase family protein [Bacillota bacterium]